MATNITLNCNLCDRDHVTKQAEEYCPQCDDALCVDCKKYHTLSRATKTHTTISIDEFQNLPSSIRKIKHSCDEHGDLFEFFCPDHDELCCKLCINFNHRTCNQTVYIPEMVKETDSSVQIDNYLKTLDDSVRNIRKAITNRRDNLTDIEQQRQSIINQVKHKRQELNKHLDKLEQELLQSLLVTHKNIKHDIEKLWKEMDEKCKEAAKLKDEIEAMKKYASDVQLFIGSKEILKPVESLKTYVKSTCESGGLDTKNIAFTINEHLNRIPDNILSFGTISSTSTQSTVKFNWHEETSAQIITVTNKTINDISLILKQTFQFGDVTACITLTDGNIIVGKQISFYDSEMLKYTSNNQLLSKVLIKNSQCFDIVSVDDDSVAVTGGDNGYNIYLIDTKNLKDVKVIKSDDYNYGATLHDGSLICCTLSHGIQRIDMATKQCTTIVSGKCWITYIVSDDNYLYHSNQHTNSIVCYDFSGNIKWTYQNEILRSPRGITIDFNSNLYVAGYDSNNIVVISSDGKQGRQILGTSDGICKPINLHLNKDRNILLVANRNGKTFLCDFQK